MGFAFLQDREAGIDFGERPLLEPSRAPGRFALEPGAASGLRLPGGSTLTRTNPEAVHDLDAALDSDPSDADTLLLLSNCYLISGK